MKDIADEVASEYEKFGPDGFSKSFDAILNEGKPRSEFDPIELPTDVIGTLRNSLHLSPILVTSDTWRS